MTFIFKEEMRVPTHWPSYVRVIRESQKEWVLSLPQSMSFQECLRGIGVSLESIEDVRVEEGALEDAFLHLVRKTGELRR